MNESEFKEVLERKIKEKLGNKEYEVKRNANLIYKVLINENLQFEPNVPNNPKRGRYAFQTDLLLTKKIKDKRLPLVVIETKFGGFSTHDILTYSSKAQKHKEIYPYLRYGLVVGGVNVIQNRFFTHNIGFDFAYALKEIEDNSLNELVEIIKGQIKNAELILDIFRNRNQARSFNTQISIKKLDGESNE
ncbi:hypothetical protein DRO59_09840 [Candidatus Bathyarchaeota archaeon]|nr:MAG: hypothetical protein DRO59_09840 [Candidatus Bathyarchaeota archaeon]